jgi:hypothetical protein
LDDVNYRRRADINERRYREKQREMEAEETQGSIFTLSRPANLTMPAPERWLKRRTAPVSVPVQVDTNAFSLLTFTTIR